MNDISEAYASPSNSSPRKFSSWAIVGGLLLLLVILVPLMTTASKVARKSQPFERELETTETEHWRCTNRRTASLAVLNFSADGQFEWRGLNLSVGLAGCWFNRRARVLSRRALAPVLVANSTRPRFCLAMQRLAERFTSRTGASAHRLSSGCAYGCS